MKSHQATENKTTAKTSFFERTSAALHPRAIFRLSNLSAVSRESRMWGVKPKQDHEIENLTTEELGDLMENDPNVKKTAEATGTTIRKAEDFGPDPETVRSKEAKLALEAKKAEKKKKKTLIFFGGLLVVGAVGAGTSVVIFGKDKGDEDIGSQLPPTDFPTASPTLTPTKSPTRTPTNAPTTGPTLSPTPEPFRILDLAEQQALCTAIKESDDFDFDSDTNVYLSCQEDQKSVFSCTGDGDLANTSNFCSLVNGGVCPCDPGQIVDATKLPQGFGDICVDEVNPDNELCVELGGDLNDLINRASSSTFQEA